MNTKQRIELLTKWKSHHDKLEDAFNTLFGVGFGTESPLHETAWLMLDGYTESLGELVGDIEICLDVLVPLRKQNGPQSNGSRVLRKGEKDQNNPRLGKTN